MLMGQVIMRLPLLLTLRTRLLLELQNPDLNYIDATRTAYKIVAEERNGNV